MATSRPAGTQNGRFFWPDLAVGSQGEPLETDPHSCSGRERLVRARALAETSAAFSAGGQNISVVCRELAERVANILLAGCLIRPLLGGVQVLPVALGQVRDDVKPEVANFIEANPQAILAACSARAAEMRCSILVSELAAKCLRLWTEQAAWPGLHKLAIRSVLVAPMCASERALGTILVWRLQPAPSLQAEDRLFVEEVARRLATAYL